MSGIDSRYPHADSELARLVRHRIMELAGTKTQRQIATEIGYDKPNALSMYKRGEAKFPLERLPALSQALNIELVVLFRAGLGQWWPGEHALLNEMFSERLVTKREREQLKLLRACVQTNEIEVTLDLLEHLKRTFKE